MSEKASRPKSPRQLAINADKALDALTSALREARDGGVTVTLTVMLNGQTINITEGLFTIRFHEELYPFKERPGFTEAI